jgi:hypothetical protein
MAHEAQTSPENETVEPRKHRGYHMIVFLFAMSGVIGTLLYQRYSQSEEQLLGAMDTMHVAGADLTATECLEAVLDWHSDCTALGRVCGEYVTHMMGACLSAEDRGAYCDALEVNTASAHFGYESCRARDLDRRRMHACGTAHRTIDLHCQMLSNEVGE